MSQLNALQKRRKTGVLVMTALLIVFAFIFYILSSRVEPITYSFYLGDEWKLISEWKVNSKSAVLIFLILSLIGVLISLIQFTNNKKITSGSVVFGLGSIMAFLSWAAAGKFIPTGMLQAAVLLAVPLIFG